MRYQKSCHRFVAALLSAFFAVPPKIPSCLKAFGRIGVMVPYLFTSRLLRSGTPMIALAAAATFAESAFAYQV